MQDVRGSNFLMIPTASMKLDLDLHMVIKPSLQIYECSWQSLSALHRGQVDGAFVYSSYLTIHC